MRTGERAEILNKGALTRLESEVTAALRRRSPSEPKLAGVLRTLAPFSSGVRNILSEVALVLFRRGACERELYASAVRSLSEAQDKRVLAVLKGALATEDAGGV